MLIDYKYICIPILIAVFLGILIFLLSYLFVQRTVDLEKISIYECGFEPFEDSRGAFEVKFYLVSILFLIFDLEVLYLFPWILTVSISGFSGMFSMFVFLFILIVIFIYEWILGALDF